MLIAKKYSIEVLNKGIIGDTTSGMLSRFYRDVVEEKARQVIIMGGSNDLILEAPLSVVKSQMATLVHHAYHYNIRPIIGVPIPACVEIAKRFWPFVHNLSEVNEQLKFYREWIYEFGMNFKCQVVDFYKHFYNFESKSVISDYYSDGLHPTVEGNQKMANAVDL